MNKFFKWTHALAFNCLNNIILCWFRDTPFACDYKAKFKVSEFCKIFLHASEKIIISINAVFSKQQEQAAECADMILEKIFFRKEVPQSWLRSGEPCRPYFFSDCMVAAYIVLLFHPFNIFPDSREQNCRQDDFQQVSRNEGIQSEIKNRFIPANEIAQPD